MVGSFSLFFSFSFLTQHPRVLKLVLPGGAGLLLPPGEGVVVVVVVVGGGGGGAEADLDHRARQAEVGGQQGSTPKKKHLGG